MNCRSCPRPNENFAPSVTFLRRPELESLEELLFYLPSSWRAEMSLPICPCLSHHLTCRIRKSSSVPRHANSVRLERHTYLIIRQSSLSIFSFQSRRTKPKGDGPFPNAWECADCAAWCSFAVVNRPYVCAILLLQFPS